jgi:hypothetical protein
MSESSDVDRLSVFDGFGYAESGYGKSPKGLAFEFVIV